MKIPFIFLKISPGFSFIGTIFFNDTMSDYFFIKIKQTEYPFWNIVC